MGNMFSENIYAIWKDWYNREKPKKYHWGLGILFAALIGIAGLVVIKFETTIAIILLVVSFIIWMIIAFKVSGKSIKMSESAVQYCFDHYIYEIGRGNKYPFMMLGEKTTIGGRVFHFESVDVNLYDTYYSGKNNGPGILIEMVPHYYLGEGRIVWKDNHIQIEGNLRLEDRLIHCIEEIITYQRSKLTYPKCHLNDNKLYIYADRAAIGLIVDENGELYIKPGINTGMMDNCNMWQAADIIMGIILKYFGNSCGIC